MGDLNLPRMRQGLWEAVYDALNPGTYYERWYFIGKAMAFWWVLMDYEPEYVGNILMSDTFFGPEKAKGDREIAPA